MNHPALICLAVGAGYMADKAPDALTLADLLVEHPVDKTPLSFGGVPVSAVNFATFPFASRGEARKGMAGVKVNGHRVDERAMDAGVLDLLGAVDPVFGWHTALVAYGKRFRCLVVVST